MSAFISIIIPLYNKERFIDNTLNSVFNQSFKNFEIIIIDDVSTDRSMDIVNKLNEENPGFLKILKNQSNQGVGYTRNQGLKRAVGDYILFLDADDQLVSTQVLNQLVLILENYNIDVLLLKRTYPNFIDKPSYDRVQSFLEAIDNPLYKITNYENFAAYGDFPFGGSGSMIMKRTIAQKHRFDEHTQRFEDWLYFIPVYLENHPYFYNQTCIEVIYDNQSLSNKPQTKAIELPAVYFYLKAHKHKGLPKKLFWKIFLGFIDVDKGLITNLKTIWSYRSMILKNHQWSCFVLKKERSVMVKLIKSLFTSKNR